MSDVLTPAELASLGVPGHEQPPVMTTTQAAPAPAAPATEMLKPALPSKEVLMPDGRRVLLQKPARPMNLMIAKVLGPDSGNPMLTVYFKTAAYVAAIDGQPLPPLRGRTDFEAVCLMLGDEGLDELSLEVNDLAYSTVDKAAVKKS